MQLQSGALPCLLHLPQLLPKFRTFALLSARPGAHVTHCVARIKYYHLLPATERHEGADGPAVGHYEIWKYYQSTNKVHAEVVQNLVA